MLHDCDEGDQRNRTWLTSKGAGDSLEGNFSVKRRDRRARYFEFIRRPEDRKAEERSRLDRLRGCGAVLREGLDLADEFAQMARKRSKLPLGEWLAKAEASGCAELRGFAGSLRTDEAAVSAALTEPWSNGPVEGQVNRLKLIKRQGYGRAGFQLLRARARYAS